MINLFGVQLPTGDAMHCGTAVTGFGHVNSHCKNSECGKKTPMLLGGYCTSCAVLKGINPLKACGVEPIRLTRAAACCAAQVPDDEAPAKEAAASDTTPAALAFAA